MNASLRGGNQTPIVVNLDHGGYRLSGADDPVVFDIDGDGQPNRITWTARGSHVAFLAIDHDRNGRIDDGSELFGNATVLASGARAANGFEALRELDSNADGLIDRHDARWGELALWVDADHDAVSQPNELRDIALTPVSALESGYHWTGRRDPAGNYFRYEGLAYFERGRKPIYDVSFISVP